MKSAIVSIFDQASASGWKVEEPSIWVNNVHSINPQCLAIGSSVYPTLINPLGAKIALSQNDLGTREGRNGVYLFDRHPSHRGVMLAGIYVYPERRGCGVAAEAMSQFVKWCDEATAEVVLEVAPFRLQGEKRLTGRQMMTAERKLFKWYLREGFASDSNYKYVMRRTPQK